MAMALSPRCAVVAARRRWSGLSTTASRNRLDYPFPRPASAAAASGATPTTKTRWDQAPQPCISPLELRSFSSLGGGIGGVEGGDTMWSSVSPRDLAVLEEQILTALRTEVVDPILNKDVTTLGWVRGVAFPRPLPPAPPASGTETTNDDHTIDPVRVSVRLPTMLHPAADELRTRIRDVVLREVTAAASRGGWTLPGECQVEITVTAAKPVPLSRTASEHADLIKRLGPGLANVTHYLAVYSCKGGVGKSTIAANLAYELSRLAGGTCRVGLLDLDVYGPSLPVLVKPDDPAVRRSPLGSGMIYPVTHRNVKLMSLGYASPNSGVPGSGSDGGAAVMRGPMAGKVVSQLLKGTDWGDLDILVLDLPPGTGDVQLEVCQAVSLSGAVCVTTPSRLAVTDALKGVEMFTTLGIPTLAAVENMAYYDCDGGGRHYPFGRGVKDEDATSALEGVNLDAANIVQLPVSSYTNVANDSGDPLCLSRPDGAGAELSAFADLARIVAEELLLIQFGQSPRGSGEAMGNEAIVSFDGDDGQGGGFDVASLHMVVNDDGRGFAVRLFSDSGAWQATVSGEELRSRDPKTGEKMNADIDEAPPKAAACGSKDTGGMVQHHEHRSQSESRLFPAKIDKKGQYGYSVEWADGSTIIYSVLCIAKAAGGKVQSQSK